jgi:predicted transcriptional regulator
MSYKEKSFLGFLETDIMNVLWKCGTVTVRDVLEDLFVWVLVYIIVMMVMNWLIVGVE